MSNVQIVPGKPEHAPAIPQLIYQTAETNFDFLYAGRHDVFTHVIEECWRADKSGFSHKLATVALVDEEVVGLLIGADQPTYKREAENTRDVIIPLLDEPLLKHMGVEGKAFFYLSPAIPESAYFMDILSVSESAQGLGIGKKLVAHAIEDAKRLNCSGIQLNTNADGDAVGFYHSLGFNTLVEARMPDLEERANIGMKLRMVFPLS